MRDDYFLELDVKIFTDAALLWYKKLNMIIPCLKSTGKTIL